MRNFAKSILNYFATYTETRFRFATKRLAHQWADDRQHDLYVLDLSEIDHVIVSRYGVFVLETKTYKGWIYGSEREPQWTQVNFKRKDRFQNPLRQNYKHTKTLSERTGIPEDRIKSLVVFVGDCTFKTTMPPNVVYVRDFVRYIEGFRTPIIEDEQEGRQPVLGLSRISNLQGHAEDGVTGRRRTTCARSSVSRS